MTTTSVVAQTPTPLPSPTPNISESQEKVRVFTEEVVIPVSAYDDSGYLSVALEPQDILVFEDDVRQTVRSWLRGLAEETDGLAFVPGSAKEMGPQADEIARAIDSQYVVTYTPKRPLAEATVEEYRRINVAPGVIGLHVHARRGYVARGQ